MSTSNDTSEIPYGYCHCGCGQKTTIAKKTRGDIKKGEPNKYVSCHKENCAQSSAFWSKVAVTANSDKCWEWQASISRKGYGRTSLYRRMRPAHRHAWELTYGTIPSDLCVLHKCDNRKCCNPRHLFLGTYQDNMDDMVAKGRDRHGEMNHNHILTRLQVVEIRERYQLGNISQREIAIEYGVGETTIFDIVSHKRWKSV